MKQFTFGVCGGLLVVASAWAQPGPGAAGQARGSDRAHVPERIAVPAHQRDELRTLIREQRAAREDERAQRPVQHLGRQLSPQERELLREQLRQQRREQRGLP